MEHITPHQIPQKLQISLTAQVRVPAFWNKISEYKRSDFSEKVEVWEFGCHYGTFSTLLQYMAGKRDEVEHLSQSSFLFLKGFQNFVYSMNILELFSFFELGVSVVDYDSEYMNGIKIYSAIIGNLVLNQRFLFAWVHEVFLLPFCGREEY